MLSQTLYHDLIPQANPPQPHPLIHVASGAQASTSSRCGDDTINYPRQPSNSFILQPSSISPSMNNSRIPYHNAVNTSMMPPPRFKRMNSGGGIPQAKSANCCERSRSSRSRSADKKETRCLNVSGEKSQMLSEAVAYLKAKISYNGVR
jgi:hypothetical protein